MKKSMFSGKAMGKDFGGHGYEPTLDFTDPDKPPYFLSAIP
jgi:hypothetical protein